MIEKLVIFGASGDLTARLLAPGLAELLACGALPEAFSVLGLARREWDREGFRRHIDAALQRHADDLSAEQRRALVERLDYRRLDGTDAAAVADALRDVRGPLAAYLALPPRLVPQTVDALAAGGLAEGSVIVCEKPFGVDFESARALNQQLARCFPESAVFRVDHFLMKQNIVNLLGLRFANRVIESLWNAQHIERVEIIYDETVALEGRAGYYDHSGALRDMIQNHLLQLVTLIGMEAPASLEQRDLHDRKTDVLRAVRRLSRDEVRRGTRRARYGAGRGPDGRVPDYVDEDGVDPSRDTETLAEVTLWIDNWRWSGVPFLLRSGKALGDRRREVVIRFRPVPHLAFVRGETAPNLLRLGLGPDCLSLELNINGPGDPFELEQITLDAALVEQQLPAYGRLLLDVLEGDTTLSIRGEEAEQAWRIVAPILAGWADGVVPLHTYPAGSAGPADTLFARSDPGQDA